MLSSLPSCISYHLPFEDGSFIIIMKDVHVHCCTAGYWRALKNNTHHLNPGNLRSIQVFNKPSPSLSIIHTVPPSPIPTMPCAIHAFGWRANTAHLLTSDLLVSTAGFEKASMDVGNGAGLDLFTSAIRLDAYNCTASGQGSFGLCK